MRNPDINKVYYLEHLSKKQKKKLFKNVGIEHSKYMIKKSKDFLVFIDGSWDIYDFNKGLKPTTNAEELFVPQSITEEASLNQVPDDSKLVKEQLTLLQEAEQIINGSRAEDYGSVTENFEKIAKGWEMIFSKGEFTPRNVANAMIWLKICRDTNTPKYDNPLDIAGYAGCIGKMINEDESKR